ncbi:unnamed protein product [Lathyrus oleraceus]
MTEIVKVFYVIILFLSLFLVAAEVLDPFVECETDTDCGKSLDMNFCYKCIHNYCEIVRKPH